MGTTWANAYDDLQDAIDQAEALRDLAGDPEAEVWVRATAQPYYPTDDANGLASPADPRDRTFNIPAGIKVQGGFDTTETIPDDRDLANARFTILSGDVALTPMNPLDDSYSVVVVPEVDPEIDRVAYLDNCTVIHGNADGLGSLLGQDERQSGGGLYAVGTQTEVRRVTFQGCSARFFGGGASFKGSGERTIGVRITRCTFQDNSAGSGGGLALRTLGQLGSPNFTDASAVYGCTFRLNRALVDETLGQPGEGGAVWVGLRDAFFAFANCVMSENTAGFQGSAIFVGTELGVSIPPTPVPIHSSTIVRNRVIGDSEVGQAGGGYAVYYDAPSSAAALGGELIRNSIVYGNLDAVGDPLQVGPPSVLTGPGPNVTIENSDVQDLVPPLTNGNINLNPQFVSATYFALQSTSPCIDAGTNSAGLPPDWGDVNDNGNTGETLPLDWRVESSATPPVGFLRTVFVTSLNTDMGAFEFVP